MQVDVRIAIARPEGELVKRQRIRVRIRYASRIPKVHLDTGRMPAIFTAAESALLFSRHSFVASFLVMDAQGRGLSL